MFSTSVIGRSDQLVGFARFNAGDGVLQLKQNVCLNELDDFAEQDVTQRFRAATDAGNHT